MTVRWIDRPELRRPALIAAFQGWNDAGDAATDAVRWLARIDRRDADRDARPRGVPRLPGRASDGRADRRRAAHGQLARAHVLRRRAWPSRPRSRAAARHRTEPEVARVLRRRRRGRAHDRMRDRRHARRAARRHAALAADPLHRLRHRRGARRAARHGAVALRRPDRASSACCTTRSAGSTSASASIWAPVPHYVASPPNPKATRAILDKLAALLDLQLDLTDLDIASAAWERSVADVVASDSDVTGYVARLEARYDESLDRRVHRRRGRRRRQTTTTGSTRTTSRRATPSPKTSSATSASTRGLSASSAIRRVRIQLRCAHACSAHVVRTTCLRSSCHSRC